MPSDDFREQTKDFRKSTISDFEVLRDRYEVLITAAVLNWLKNTKSRAMIVVSRDGFIDWSWGSPTLLASGVYFKAKTVTTPVPDVSPAALGPASGLTAIQHPTGVWSRSEPLFESVLFAEYHEMSISLLVYPTDGRTRRFEDHAGDTVTLP